MSLKLPTCKVNSLSERRPAPIAICYEKQPLPFYHLDLSSNKANEATPLLHAVLALTVCSGIQKLETHSKYDLLSENPNLEIDVALFPNGVKQHIMRLGQ